MFMKVNVNRVDVLRLLYEDINSANQQAHRKCIDEIGLIDASWYDEERKKLFKSAFEERVAAAVQIAIDKLTTDIFCKTGDEKVLQHVIFNAVTKELHIANPTEYAVKTMRQLITKIVAAGARELPPTAVVDGVQPSTSSTHVEHAALDVPEPAVQTVSIDVTQSAFNEEIVEIVALTDQPDIQALSTKMTTPVLNVVATAAAPNAVQEAAAHEDTNQRQQFINGFRI